MCNTKIERDGSTVLSALRIRLAAKFFKIISLRVRDAPVIVAVAMSRVGNVGAKVQLLNPSTRKRLRLRSQVTRQKPGTIAVVRLARPTASACKEARPEETPTLASPGIHGDVAHVAISRTTSQEMILKNLHEADLPSSYVRPKLDFEESRLSATACVSNFSRIYRNRSIRFNVVLRDLHVIKQPPGQRYTVGKYFATEYSDTSSSHSTSLFELDIDDIAA